MTSLDFGKLQSINLKLHLIYYCLKISVLLEIICLK